MQKCELAWSCHPLVKYWCFWSHVNQTKICSPSCMSLGLSLRLRDHICFFSWSLQGFFNIQQTNDLLNFYWLPLISNRSSSIKMCFLRHKQVSIDWNDEHWGTLEDIWCHSLGIQVQTHENKGLHDQMKWSNIRTEKHPEFPLIIMWLNKILYIPHM